MIESALTDYRQARDGTPPQSRSLKGIKYAATRADIVAHSMGGLLTKWYIAQTGLAGSMQRPGFPSPQYDINDVRVPYSNPSGRWAYLRPDNYGAGSIRRFISIGTPFQGSGVTAAFAAVALPGPGGVNNPTPNYIWATRKLFPLEDMKENREQLFPPNGVISAQNYIYPTALSDLQPNSPALNILASSAFPTGHKQVRWHPFIGQASPFVASPQEIFNCKISWRVDQLTGMRADFINHGLGPNALFLPNATSDLTVLMSSQRNFTPTRPQNANAGRVVTRTTHGYYRTCVRQDQNIVISGEPDSLPIRDLILELLGQDLSPIDSAWTIN